MTDHNKAHIATPSSNENLDVQFLTEKQLAKRHQRNPKTLRNDRVTGCYIPFHKCGLRSVRYRLSDVIAYEQAQRVACMNVGIGDCTASSADLRAETFLTPRELAARHQREEKTLRNDRVYQRYISFYKLGGQVRYALSDVVAYEHSHRMTSTTEAHARDAQRPALSRAHAAQHSGPNAL